MKSRAVGRRNLAGENVRMALTTLWSQKLRSGLTLLGIIIGVATVIAMVSMIQGVNGSVSKQIGSLGTGVLYISKEEAGIHIGGMEQRKPRKDLTVDDADAIARNCPAVGTVSPEIRDMRRIAFAGVETKTISVAGSGEEFLTANNWSVDRGRPFTTDDVRHAGPVCLLGASIAEQLFPNGGS